MFYWGRSAEVILCEPLAYECYSEISNEYL